MYSTTEEIGGKDGNLWCVIRDLSVVRFRIGNVLKKEICILANVHTFLKVSVGCLVSN